MFPGLPVFSDGSLSASLAHPVILWVKSHVISGRSRSDFRGASARKPEAPRIPVLQPLRLSLWTRQHLRRRTRDVTWDAQRRLRRANRPPGRNRSSSAHGRAEPCSPAVTRPDHHPGFVVSAALSSAQSNPPSTPSSPLPSTSTHLRPPPFLVRRRSPPEPPPPRPRSSRRPIVCEVDCAVVLRMLARRRGRGVGGLEGGGRLLKSGPDRRRWRREQTSSARK